jgi:non-ribosomal peptide synthetase component F
LLAQAPPALTEIGLGGTLEYKVDLFDGVTIERWLGHWGTLLAGIAADPDRGLADLPLLAPAEQHQVTVEWNDTGEGALGEATLHGLFLEKAAARPGAVAVMAPDEDLTYADLARQAEALAAALIRQGLRPGGRVGVLLERSADAVASLLAVLQAGGAYVPLDPAYPAERLAFQMADAGATLLLTRAGLLAGLELPEGVEGVLVDPHPQPLSHLPSTPPPGEGGTLAKDSLQGSFSEAFSPFPGIGRAGDGRGPGGEGLPELPADAMAYVIYTSGSTGRPKGVMIEHRQAVNTLLDINRRFDVREDDRVFAVSSLAFDLSVWDVFGTLAAGGTVILPAPAPQPDPIAWSERMAQCGVTIWNSAPPLLEMLVES